MYNVKERINELAKYAGCQNMKALSDALGLKTPQIFYDIMSGKVSGISGRLAGKIIHEYPEIRKEWLLLGEGEMLNARKPETPAATGIDLEKSMLNLWNELHELKERVRILEEGGAHTKKDLA